MMEDHILISKNFSKLNLEFTQKISANGRPTPELKDLLQTTGSVQNETAKQFNFEGVKPGIVKFILNMEHHKTALQKLLKTIADVNINVSNLSIEVKPNHITRGWNHSEFERECCIKTKRFFAKFDIWTGQYDKQELKTKSQIKPHLFKTHSHSDLNVKWFDSGAVIVVGIQNEVSKCIQEIEDTFTTSSTLAHLPSPLYIETAQHVRKIRPIIGTFNGNDQVILNGFKVPRRFPTPQSAAALGFPKPAPNPKRITNKPVTSPCAPTSLRGCRSKGPRPTQDCSTQDCSSKPLNNLRIGPTGPPGNRLNCPRPHTSQKFAYTPLVAAHEYAQHQNISSNQNVQEKTPPSSLISWRSVQNESAKQFNFEGVKPGIVKFILKTEHHKTALQNLMKTIADIDICPSNITIAVKPNHITSAWNHSEFEKECRIKLERFFAKFDLWKGQYDAQELKAKSQIKPHLFEMHCNSDLDIKGFDSGAVIVVGIQNEVKKCKQEIEDTFTTSSALAHPPPPLNIEAAQLVHKIIPSKGTFNGNDGGNQNGFRLTGPRHFPTPQSAATPKPKPATKPAINYPKPVTNPNQTSNKPVTSCAPTNLHGCKSKDPRPYPTQNLSSTPPDHLRRTGSTTLRGLKEKVARYKETVNELKSFVEEDYLPVDKFIAQRECGVWRKVEKMCEENGLQVSLHPNPNGKIIYKGNRDAIKSAKELVEKIWEELFVRPITGFSKNHEEFLKKCKSSQKNFFKTKENVLDDVYQEFRDKSTCGSLLFDESSIRLVSSGEDLWVEANKILLNFIHVYGVDGKNQIPVKKLYLKIKPFFENKPVLVKEEENKEVLVYCLKTRSDETHKTVASILLDTVQACKEVEKFHPMPKEKAQHICTQCKIPNAKIEVKQHDGQIGLLITCKNEDIDAVAMRLEELNKQITDISGSISGYYLYERLKDNRKCLKIERDTSCSIFLQPLQSISCSVSVKVGDILNEDCDAIINSTGDGLDFDSTNQLSKALITKYGTGIILSISRKQTSVLIPNQARSFVTKDLLPWNYIINVAIPRDSNKLKQFISDLLHSVDNAGIKSLALPTIGTGNMGLDPYTVAKCMSDAFHTFSFDSNVKNLKDIRVVVYNSELLTIFQKGVPAQKSAFAGIAIKIYGNSLHKMNQAYKKLTDLCSATVATAVIQNHSTVCLSHYIKAKINELCGRLLIHLEWRNNGTKEECHLEGPQDHVQKAKKEIETLLDADIPYYWESMSDEKFVLKEVHDSAEYRDVEAKFKKSSPRYSRITKIERIQNPFLYKQFQTRKDIVKSDVTSQCVTRELFHGTLPDKARKIYSAGFDRNYAGDNGTKYGKGVYFHINSNYSVNYCGNTHHEKNIFLAEVITGDYVQGKSKYKSPPENLTTKRLYDSVVDDVHNPNIFVVFRDSSVYPMYLIHFI